MQTNYQSGDACCFTGREPGLDPTQESNVVLAGEVCTRERCGEEAVSSGGGGRLAQTLAGIITATGKGSVLCWQPIPRQKTIC